MRLKIKKHLKLIIPLALIILILVIAFVSSRNSSGVYADQSKNLTDILHTYDDNFNNGIEFNLNLAEVVKEMNYTKVVFEGKNFSIKAFAVDEDSATLHAGGCTIFKPSFYLIRNNEASELTIENIFNLATPKNNEDFMNFLKVYNSFFNSYCGIKPFYTINDAEYKPTNTKCSVSVATNIKSTLLQKDNGTEFTYYYESSTYPLSLYKQKFVIVDNKISISQPESVYECNEGPIL